MVDALTGTYRLSCPHRGEARVRLSAFRELDLLPGAAHPAVFRVRFACACGEEHTGLVSHDELDWGLLGITPDRTFTGDDVAFELALHTVERLERGEWPWTFFCYLESRSRPVTPSSFLAVSGSATGLGVAVRCPVCDATSVNLVSEQHVDVPFVHDRHVGVVDHVFDADAARALEQFAAELASPAFDVRRLDL